ncbi:MAG: pyruvate formate-lyase [Clostridiales bacterium]|nr:pyruvate formate-lyase [Clostridiales bacterium]
MIAERIQKMREIVVNARPSLSAERLVLVTEAYREFGGEAAPVFRARVFAYVLDHMELLIRDGELLVGSTNKRIRSASVFPEYTGQWLLQKDENGMLGLDRLPVRPNDPLDVLPEDRETILKTMKWWMGKSTEEASETFLTTDVQEARKSGVLSVGGRAIASGKTVPDYALMFQRGLKGYIQMCRDRIAEQVEKGVDVDAQPRLDFWNACIICAEGMIRYARRYADLAERMSKKENSSQRKRELLEIARICRKVPENPPETFYEGLQFMWFIYHGLYIETNASANGFGRFDEYMGPLYEKDVATGAITEAFAEELISCLFVKSMEIIMLRPDDYSRDFAGYPLWQILMLGGVDRRGADVTNAVTRMTLNVASQLKFSQPAVALRVHEKTPEDIWRKGCEMIQDGQANPAFFGDQAALKIVQEKGGTLEEAREWIILGCVEPHPGMGGTDGSPYGGYVNFPKCLELVMHGGVDPLTGKLLGPVVDVESLKTFDDVMKAVKMELRHWYDLLHKGFNQIVAYHCTRIPCVYSSMLLEGCIEKGIAVQSGGANHTYSGIFCTGPASLADALVAVKQYVFDEKKLTLEELTEILDQNFEGNERLRLELLNKVPKYGNDNEEVDGICCELIRDTAHYVQQMTDARHGHYCFCNQAQTVSVTMGYKVGATADGRFAYTPLSDNAGPMMGRDTEGPTATVNSMSRNMCQCELYDGTLMNLRFDPSGVAGEKGLHILESVIKEYVQQDGLHIQINVVDDRTLRAAQKDPENYRDIVVRVAGYMAYFTELDLTVQNAIIARTAHLAS